MYLLSYVKIRGSVDWGKVWPIIEDLRYVVTHKEIRLFVQCEKHAVGNNTSIRSILYITAAEYICIGYTSEILEKN